MTKNICFLCNENASVEEVRGEHRQRLDVLCQSNCPQYEISTTAVEKLTNIPPRQEEAKSAVSIISKSGKYPVIRYDAINSKLIYTSKEEE